MEVLKSFINASSNDLKESVVSEPVAIYNSGSLSGFDIFLSFLNDRFDRIESQLRSVDNKLEKVLVIIQELKLDFASIQKLPRDEDEKLFKLCQKIDAKLDGVYKNDHHTIEGYIEEIKRWLTVFGNCWIYKVKNFYPLRSLFLMS